jgi:hypothetical protein
MTEKLLALKQRYENRSATVIALKNPVLFFVKIVANMEKQPYLYWYAYSIGRVKNIFWGVYKTRTKKFNLIGSCYFKDTGPLNDTLAYKKTLGFNLVSSSTKNRIDKRINQWLPEDQQYESALNRTDISQQIILSENYVFLEKVNDQFLDYIERNTQLMYNAEKICLRKDNCYNQDDLDLFGSDGCDQFCYGSFDCLHPKDTPSIQ